MKHHVYRAVSILSAAAIHGTRLFEPMSTAVPAEGKSAYLIRTDIDVSNKRGRFKIFGDKRNRKRKWRLD
jgi:hypothetical protein